MNKKDLKNKIYAKIDELPTLPVVITRLLSLIEDEKSDAGALGDVIARDPALTAKVLKVANSAYYGFSQEISSLDRAVPLLGLNMVKSLALSIGVVQSLPTPREMPHFSGRGLWLHSLAVATVIKELSRRLGAQREGEYLFVVGLLHDVGKIVLINFFPETYLQILTQVEDKQEEPLFMAERRVLGVDHGEVGAMLLSRWKFPAKVIGPIKWHHQSEPPQATEPWDVALVKVADALPQEIDLGEEGNPVPSKVTEADLRMLQLKQDGLTRMREFLLSQQESIQDFYSAMS